MRELLKEAREILGDCYYDGKEPLSDGTRAMVAKVIKRIDAALAAPEPDAKWESIISKIRATDSKGEYRLDYWLAQKLIEEFAEQHAEAAALIAAAPDMAAWIKRALPYMRLDLKRRRFTDYDDGENKAYGDKDIAELTALIQEATK